MSRRRSHLRLTATPLRALLVLASWLPLGGVAAGAGRVPTDPGPDPTLWRTLRASQARVDPGVPRVRARGDRFEVVRGGTGTPVFFRGVNLGAAMPGHFPGEFAIGYDDYRRWLRFARALHANAVRVYALHPPAFYRALNDENAEHPEHPLWLFQEAWTELPETNDFWTPAYRHGFEREIRMAIDALHGNAVVTPRPGHASGRYDVDASRWLAGWLLGREWEPYAVRETQRLHPDSTSYRGAIVTVEDGTAMECWLGRVCDVAARYERRNYGVARAVSFVNWPTLDPMRHPTETERGGGEAEHDEDAYSVDPTRLKVRADAFEDDGFLGYFADYHVYPYYPDFMNLDPGYGAFRDRHGACHYAGYLADLKSHTRGIPLLIGEYGVPSSRGVAHLQPEGIDHGGASEDEQGRRDVRLLEDIEACGASGSLLFSLFDEWFKVNWLVQKGEWPRDRDPLWHNLLDPEECYGLIGFDAPAAIAVDGDTTDWRGVAPYAVPVPEAAGRGGRAGAPRFLRALYATSDQARFYLRIDLEAGAAAKGLRAVGVAFDVLDAARGDRRLPAPVRATWSRGAERVLVIEPAAGDGVRARRRASLFADAAMRPSEYSRALVGGAYQILRAPYRPVANDDGRYLPIVLETNRERVSRSGQLYPARLLDAGRLAYGREPAARVAWPGARPSRPYDPHAEWCLDAAGRSIEVAIPWGLLGIGDPSSHAVIDDRDGTAAIETSATPGIALLAWATGARGARADSLGPSEAAPPAAREAVQFLGPRGTTQRVAGQGVAVTSPAESAVMWNAWDVPISEEHVKTSARFVRTAFEGMEARETKNETSLDKRR